MIAEVHMMPVPDVHPLITVTRYFIVAMGVLVAIVGTAQWRRWRAFLPENQFAWLALATSNLALVFGNVEVLIHPNPGGPRTYIAAVAVIFELWAVCHYPVHKLRRERRARRLVRAALKSKEP